MNKRRTTWVLALALAGLGFTVQSRAEADGDWVANSNQHAQVVLEVMARFGPEGAAALGVDGTLHAAVPDGARRAADRIRRIARRYRETVANEVNPTADGMELLELDPFLAAEVLAA